MESIIEKICLSFFDRLLVCKRERDYLRDRERERERECGSMSSMNRFGQHFKSICLQANLCKMLNLVWKFFNAIGHIVIVTNGQILKK